ncbi:4'-phosphopantetheinyl transferase superfamily protein [Paraburkholderia sp.]|uniref:4'-phosphopantetheinyl transferase family protein n=1 Tax=Paraburkholderia sp. TaxID=1926495 RepID=UPI00239C75D4|nr:4'-phosphopantetheinyl transferase superfamily protein [Paraburkholderia sp.]MDE1180145.1 4'-phosphopantetheinyl transferase superfamily protein [Paraburkholderia sp.]
MNRVRTVSLPHGGPSDLDVVRVEIDFDATLDDAAFAALSTDERARAQRFYRHEDTLRFASVRAALRDLLSARLGIAARDVRFASGENGRPCVTQSAHGAVCAPDFNVSHSGAYGLIALSDQRRVGVDIEQHSERVEWRSLSRATLTGSEIAWIDSLDADAQLRAFYDAWSAKEALLKAIGVGIAGGLPRLAVLPRDGMHVVARHWTLDHPPTLEAAWLDAPAAYAACVAWSTA